MQEKGGGMSPPPPYYVPIIVQNIDPYINKGQVHSICMSIDNRTFLKKVL